MSELINNNSLFSTQANHQKIPTEAPISQMLLTVAKIRGVFEFKIMTITLHEPRSMNPLISITTEPAFLHPELLFILDMLLSESSFESKIPSYRQAPRSQKQPHYHRPQPQYNPRPNTYNSRPHYARPNTEGPKPGPKAAPGWDQAPKAKSHSRYTAAEYAFLGGNKSSTSSDAEILGVPANASQKQIKDAFKKLALEKHPDKNKDPLANNAFKILREAYDRLLAKAPAAPKKAKENQATPKAQPKPSAPEAPQPSSADWSASARQKQPEYYDEKRNHDAPPPSAPPAPQPSVADVAPSAPSFESLPPNKGPAAHGW